MFKVNPIIDIPESLDDFEDCAGDHWPMIFKNNQNSSKLYFGDSDGPPYQRDKFLLCTECGEERNFITMSREEAKTFVLMICNYMQFNHTISDPSKNFVHDSTVDIDSSCGGE